MYYVFYKTCDVFSAEEKLQAENIKTEIVPTPVQDKAYCGVCVSINDNDCNAADSILEGYEYKKV